MRRSVTSIDETYRNVTSNADVDQVHQRAVRRKTARRTRSTRSSGTGRNVFLPEFPIPSARSGDSKQQDESYSSSSFSYSTISSQSVVPDGGWGWVVAFSSFFINVIIIGMHNSFGILYLDLVDSFDESLSRTAWVGSIAFGCILSFAPMSGILANKYGCRPVSAVGIVLASASLFISSYAPSVTVMFFTYGFCYGLGTSLCYVQGAVMVSRYFDKRRALASGIALSGSTMGALAMAPFYENLRRCLGWRVALKVISGCTLMTLICAASYRPLQKPGTIKSKDRLKNSPSKKHIKDFALFKNKAFLIWAGAVGLNKLGYLVPWVHMVKLATDLGLPRRFGSQMIQYMGVAATISRLTIGKVADIPNVNRQYVAQFSTFMMGMINIIHAYTRTFPGLIAYAVSLGMLDGGVEILLPVMTLDIVGAEQLSVAWGLILAVIAVSALGPPVAGQIRDTTGSYLWAFYFAGIPMIASAFVLLLIPWAKTLHQDIKTSIMSIDPAHLEEESKKSSKSPKPLVRKKAQRITDKTPPKAKKDSILKSPKQLARKQVKRVTDTLPSKARKGSRAKSPKPLVKKKAQRHTEKPPSKARKGSTAEAKKVSREKPKKKKYVKRNKSGR